MVISFKRGYNLAEGGPFMNSFADSFSFIVEHIHTNDLINVG